MFWKMSGAVDSHWMDASHFQRFDNRLWFLTAITRLGLGGGSWIYYIASGLLLLELLMRWSIGRLNWDDFEWQYYTQACHNRRIIKTSREYFGLVPVDTRRGDVVALFAGSRVPLIIRPTGQRWRLVGECYIHGVMDGEAFDEGGCKCMWIE